jgi:NADPH:quinone reductase-like Zn-dependent oxidoreductase
MPSKNTQNRYQLIKYGSEFRLELQGEAEIRDPGPHDVVIRVRATSINRRDIMIWRGAYPIGDRVSVVPLSDGAGEVVAVGDAVTRIKVGDRVVGQFFQKWLHGRALASTGESALGGARDGMLAEYVTLHEEGVLPFPDHLSFEEAATLPCAALTAWNSLVTRGGLGRGDFVLLQGTGGVSIFGLQFAVALQATAIITSSSALKLSRARELGATHLINYRDTPEWAPVVLAATGGVGAHHVLEVGGVGTLAQSLASLAHGGHIAIIGGLAGFGGEIPAANMIGRSTNVSGIFVGSRSEFEVMNSFIHQHRLKPIIDRVFEFSQAQAAFEYMEQGNHFGKVVIRHDLKSNWA